jgi:putative transposase
MKKSRFTDIQIMDALNRADAGIRIWRHGRVDDGGDEGLNEEKRRLRKMSVDERLKAEIVQEALAKKW